MPTPLKVETSLDAAELEKLRAFTREKKRSVDAIHEWLLAAGYTVGRTAAWNWKQKDDAEQIRERFRCSNEIAKALIEAADGGTVKIGDAVNLQIGQEIFEKLAVGELSVKDLVSLSAAMKNTITGQRHVEKLKGEQKAALAEADKLAKAGGSGEAVVNRVREILGVK